MKLRDTYFNDPIYWDKEGEFSREETREDADIAKVEMMKEDGDMLRVDHLEPLTSDEAFQHFNSKSK